MKKTQITTAQAATLMHMATLKNMATTLKGQTQDHADQRKTYRDQANQLAQDLPATVRVAFMAVTADGPEALADVLADHASIID